MKRKERRTAKKTKPQDTVLPVDGRLTLASRRNQGEAKGPVGRPSKFILSRIKKFLKLISMGMPLGHAANGVGWTFASFSNYRRDYPKFAQMVEAAQSKGIAARLAVVEKCLHSNDESIRLRSATWFLEHAPGASEHFSKTRLEVSGSVAMPVVQITLPKKDTLEDLIEVGDAQPPQKTLLETNHND